MDRLREQMRSFYGPLRWGGIETNAAYMGLRERVWAMMDRFVAEHPQASACELKSRLHAEMAEAFEPTIFPDSPFFFEMGVRPAENWGTLYGTLIANWLFTRRAERYRQTPEFRNLISLNFHGDSSVKVWNIGDIFDADHHSLNYTKLLRVGVNGIIAEIDARLATASADQRAFLESARQSNVALLRVAERFAEKARAVLREASEPRSRTFLTMIAETAGRIPAEPPKTFYEGLAAILFLREAVASLDCVGISVVGHVDRLLGELYRRDIAEGRLTRDQAADLLARWMMYTDVKFHIEDNTWPETSTCIELGGCDASGAPVFNELTQLIIETHHAHKLVNPKLNCRYGATSPKEYLDVMAKAVAAGHNNFAFLNDDVLIPSLVKSGKSIEDARLYVNGGCQETIVEGVEHSAGAYYYFNMARVLDLCLQPIDAAATANLSEEACEAIPPVIEPTASFDVFYERFCEIVKTTIRQGAAWMRTLAGQWHEIHPCPLFSSAIEGCVASGRDYTQGGARYNPAGVALVGLGTVVDSLYAIRRAVFEERWVTLAELRRALADNWSGHEALRQRLLLLPKYGEGQAEVDGLAAAFAREITADVATIPNERGGYYQASMFVYYFFLWLGKMVRATPDGRCDCDLLSQGCSPSRTRARECLPDVLHSIGAVDFTDFPGNAVLDLQLPIGGRMKPEVVSALLRTFARFGGMTLQTNAVSVETLCEAKAQPERHRDLIVRISGLSARFVSLDGEVQDEIIHRTMMSV